MSKLGRTMMNRREFVRASAVGAATIAVAAHGVNPAPAVPIQPAAAPATSLPPYVGAGSTAPVRPLPFANVRLADGLLKEKQDLMLDFIRRYDENRMLIAFRENAGLPFDTTLERPGSWENDTMLRGHYAGHFMSALAMSYGASGEQVFKDKLDHMVEELAECQDAITARMGSGGGDTSPEEPTIDRVPGRFGSALRLNGPGSAQYIDLPQEVTAQLSDFTIATWVNLGSEQYWSRVFDFGNSTTVNMFLTPRAGVAGTPPRFAITTGGSGQEQQINGSTVIPVGEWVHLAVTLAGTTGTLYVNGQPVGTNPNLTLNPSRLGPLSNRWIGRSQYGDPLIDATLDEFHVFDRALSAGEVGSLQASPAGSTGGGSIAWYRFDEGGGASAVDSSPNARDAGIIAAVDDGSDDWEPTHPGYLGAVPEDVVLRLGPPRWAVYGGNQSTNTWAPWYTLHKIMRGLLDSYTLTGNEQAFDVAGKMADWAHLALTAGDINHPDYNGPLTQSDRNRMWDLYIAGEYGGANEPFPEIYALTGDAKHLQTARFFDNRASLFDASVNDDDILVVTSENNPGPLRPNRLHANTHIPNYPGYLRIYEQSGDVEYLLAAKHFFGWVVPHRMYAHGGTGGNYPGSNNNSEMFQNRGNIANSIASGGAETCAAYNLQKLARNLFCHEQDPAYMDYCERVLLNQIAGSRSDSPNPSGTVTQPMVTYFQPLTPGAQKGDYGNAGTCCGGTGLENHVKYQETIYFTSADESTLFVNLYAASAVTLAERDFTVTQETDYPREQGTVITVDGRGPLDLKLRVPWWVDKGFHVLVNGVAQGVDARPSSYVTIRRNWSPGDTVEVSMPFSIRIERAIDRPDTQSVFWGPLLMPILGNPEGAGAFRELSLYRFLKRDGDYSREAITPVAGQGIEFTTQGLTLRPWYVGDRAEQSPYFRRVEPEIVFGSVETGVPNYTRNDGLPDYDVPVDGIPSPGSDGLTFLDVVWDQAPFATHGAFLKAVAQTTEEFVKRGQMTTDEKDTVIRAAGQSEAALNPMPR